MSQTDQIDDEKPLDPAAERLRRKMVALLAVSIGFMLVAVMIVLGVIVYRVASTGDPVFDGVPIAIELPGDARIVETSLDGERLLVRTEGPDGASLSIFSARDGRLLNRFEIGSGAPE